MTNQNTLSALAPNASKLLSLADKNNSEKPEVVFSEHAIYRLKYGRDIRQINEGEGDLTRTIPIMRYRYRLQTEEEIVRLQLAYHMIHAKFSQYTPRSRRVELANDHRHKDKTGAVCVYVAGMITDFALGPNGRLGRICLISPTVLRDPRKFSGKPIDSHLWLRADRLHVFGDYGDPDDDDPNLHGQVDNPSGDINIGDTVVLAGRLHVYTDSHGVRRIGIGEWSPLGRSLLYSFADKDLRDTVHHVPRHKVKHLRLLKIESDGTPLWADPHMLEQELRRCRRMYPSSADEMHLTQEIK